MKDSWAHVSLGDVAQVRSGVGFPPRMQGRSSGAYPLAKVGDLSRVFRGGSTLIDSADHYVDEEDLSELRATPLPANSILFPKIGESIRLNYRLLTRRPMLVDNNVMAVLPNEARVDPVFLIRFLQSVDLYKFAIATAVPSIRKTDVEAIGVPLPPLDVQRRIVAKLDALLAQTRAAREQLEQVPALIEQYRQSVLAAAFRGDLTADWRKKNPAVEPASKLLERIRAERRTAWEAAELAKMKAKGKEPKDDKWKAKYEESEAVEQGSLPEGWAAVELGQVVTRLTNGYVGPTRDIYQDQGVPYLLSKHVKRNLLSFDKETFISAAFNERNKKSILKSGDVLLVQTGHVGESAAVPPEHEGHNCHAMIVITPLAPVLDGQYLSLFFSGPQGQAAFASMEKGMTLRHLNCHDVIHLTTRIPPIDEQRELVRRIASLLGRSGVVSERLRQVAARLAEVDRALLARAFSAELVT